MGIFDFNNRSLELKLSLPKQPPIMDPRIETRVKELTAWVENLPYANTQHTIDLLYESLTGLNRYPVSSLIRFALLEQYHIAYHALPHEQLGASRAGLVSVTKHHQQKLASKIYPLTSALALGYKTVVNDSVKQKFRWGHNKFVKAVQRVMEYMILETLECYDAYDQCPKKSWYDIHQLFVWAVNHDIEAIPLDDGMTIEKIYTTIGLVSLADPYRLPVGGCRILYQFFVQHTDRVHFLEHEAVEQAKDCVVIDLESDCGRWLPLDMAMHHDESRYQIIQISELVQLLHQQLKVINTGGKIPNVDASNKELKLLLEHWLSASNESQERRGEKRQAKSNPILSACGMDHVYYFCNKNQAFDPLQGRVVNDTDEVIELGASMGQTLIKTEKDHILFKGQLVDVNQGGMGFLLTYPGPDELSVGQLMGLKAGEKTWYLGIIRWLCRQGNGFRGGIQLLPSGLQPIALLAQNSGGREYQMAFITEAHQRRYLLTPANVYRDQSSVTIRQRQDYTVIADQLVMESNCCECFVIKGEH